MKFQIKNVLYLVFLTIFVTFSRDDEEYISLLKAQEPSALEIAAEQMRLWPSLPPGLYKDI